MYFIITLQTMLVNRNNILFQIKYVENKQYFLKLFSCALVLTDNFSCFFSQKVQKGGVVAYLYHIIKIM